MPENDSLITDMTAVSFVRMMGELSGLTEEAALERADSKSITALTEPESLHR